YGLAHLRTSSLGNVDKPFCNPPPAGRAVSHMQFIDDLSYVHGAHTIRVGENIRMYRHNDQRGVPGGFNEAPTIVFDRTIRPSGFTLPTDINSTDANNLQNAILELIGIPGRVQQAFVANI